MKHLQSSDELQEKALFYAIGALPEDARREYARHLEDDGCAVCVAESLEFQSVAQSLALSIPPETPAAAVKERLLDGVRRESRSETRPALVSGKPPRQSSAWQWAGWGLAAAAIVALAVVVNTNSTLQRSIDALSIRVAELETQVTRDRTVLASLTEPQLRVLNLAGQPAMPQARGRIFWSEADRFWLVSLAGLPPVSADRSYQLWFVPQQGNPVSAQVFNTNADGSAMLQIQLPADATMLKAAAVTTEPVGGLPQPSGAFVLLGGD